MKPPFGLAFVGLTSGNCTGITWSLRLKLFTYWCTYKKQKFLLIFYCYCFFFIFIFEMKMVIAHPDTQVVQKLISMEFLKFCVWNLFMINSMNHFLINRLGKYWCFILTQSKRISIGFLFFEILIAIYLWVLFKI